MTDAYLFIESGLGGGISHISNQLATANKKYMSDTCNAAKKSTYLAHVDAINLYIWTSYVYVSIDEKIQDKN